MRSPASVQGKSHWLSPNDRLLERSHHPTLAPKLCRGSAGMSLRSKKSRHQDAARNLDVAVIPAAQLSREDVEAWSSFQEADPTLASPFFRPEFTEAIAAIRNDVYVGVLSDDGRTVGFFPFQRGRRPIGAPVGGRRSNYHGVIAEPGTDWDAVALVRACGLRIWDFDHVVASQRQFAPFHSALGESYCVDVSGGFEEYVRRREAAGSRVIPRLRQKARRFEREVGPLRFESHVADPEVLHTMMGWKSEQYRRTGMVDKFAIGSNVRMLERIHACQSPGFSSMLTALYVGDQLAAVDMGIRSRSVYHSWFPAYNRELSRHSPGLVLYLKLLESAQSLGLKTIDFGKDHAQYKERMATDLIPLAEGSVLVPSPYAAIRRTRRRIEGAVRRTPLERPARRLLRPALLVPRLRCGGVQARRRAALTARPAGRGLRGFGIARPVSMWRKPWQTSLNRERARLPSWLTP